MKWIDRLITGGRTFDEIQADLDTALREHVAAKRAAERRDAREGGAPDDARVFSIMALHCQIGDGLSTVVCPTCRALVLAEDYGAHEEWHTRGVAPCLIKRLRRR